MSSPPIWLGSTVALGSKMHESPNAEAIISTINTNRLPHTLNLENMTCLEFYVPVALECIADAGAFSPVLLDADTQ